MHPPRRACRNRGRHDKKLALRPTTFPPPSPGDSEGLTKRLPLRLGDSHGFPLPLCDCETGGIDGRRETWLDRLDLLRDAVTTTPPRHGGAGIGRRTCTAQPFKFLRRAPHTSPQTLVHVGYILPPPSASLPCQQARFPSESKQRPPSSPPPRAICLILREAFELVLALLARHRGGHASTHAVHARDPQKDRLGCGDRLSCLANGASSILS